MPLYDSCKCLSDELHKILKKAVDALKDIELGDTSKLEKEREAKLKEPLESVEKLSAYMSSEDIDKLKEQIYAKVPISDEERLFHDLDKYLESCKCPDDVHIGWNKFPYGQKYSTKPVESTKTGTRTKKVTTLSTDEATEIGMEIRNFGRKIKDSLDNPVVFTEILNHPVIHGNQQNMSWGNTRDALHDLGYISDDELSRVNTLNKKYIESGGTDLIYNQAVDFLKLRKAKSIPVDISKKSK